MGRDSCCTISEEFPAHSRFLCLAVLPPLGTSPYDVGRKVVAGIRQHISVLSKRVPDAVSQHPLRHHDARLALSARLAYLLGDVPEALGFLLDERIDLGACLAGKGSKGGIVVVVLVTKRQPADM